MDPESGQQRHDNAGTYCALEAGGGIGALHRPAGCGRQPPPIVTIAKGSKQLIRLIKQGTIPSGVEQAYRIIVDEIPSRMPKRNRPWASNCKCAIPFLYLFMGRGSPPLNEGAHHALANTQQLSWRVVQEGGNPRCRSVIRDVHVRLSQVTVEQGGQKRTVAEGLLGYVLPGSTRSWPLPAGIYQPNRMSAQINARDTQWQSTPGQLKPAMIDPAFASVPAPLPKPATTVYRRRRMHGR